MKTVNKALDIIETMNNHQDGLRLSEISKLTGINSSTVRRINSTLVKRGYLFQKQKRNKYILGHKFLEFTSPSDSVMSLKELAYPFIQKLSEAVSETVVMGMLKEFECVPIADSVPDQLLRVVSNEKNKLPLHCTAIGKVLLSYMPDKRIAYYFNTTKFVPYTDNTVINKIQLKNEIDIIRRDGVAFDDEEHIIGIRSVAAPVFGENKAVLSAISIVAPSVRLSSMKMRQLASSVKSCALSISKSLGYKGN